MRPLPRPRPRRRSPLRRPSSTTVLALAAALATFVFVQSIGAASDRARRQWGPTATALVATSDLPPGHQIDAGDLTRVEVPRALVPAGSVDSEAVGRTVRTELTAGEIVLEHRLSGPGTHGLAALLDPDERGVAVPRSGADLPLATGDQVDVLATVHPTTATAADPTLLLVQRATVIATDAETVTLAVDREDARTLTHALVSATVTLVLVG